MAFSVNIRGVTVTCESPDELDDLINRFMPAETKQAFEHAISTTNFLDELIQGLEQHVPRDTPRTVAGIVHAVGALRSRADERDVLRRDLADLTRTIREAMGVPKPIDAEWTFQHAIDQIQGLVRSYQVLANCGVPDGPAGLTKCGRQDCPKCHPQNDAIDLGKLAERIVYQCISPTLGNVPGWDDLPQPRRAQIVTLWIELIEKHLRTKVPLPLAFKPIVPEISINNIRAALDEWGRGHKNYAEVRSMIMGALGLQGLKVLGSA